MPRYKVTTFDVCASGFERIRHNNEFILLTYIEPDTTLDTLRAAWLDDLQQCDHSDHSDDFDYDAAGQAVSDFCDGLVNTFSKTNPFSLEPVGEDDEPCLALLYIRDLYTGI